MSVCINEKAHQISSDFPKSGDDQLCDFLMESKLPCVQIEKLNNYKQISIYLYLATMTLIEDLESFYELLLKYDEDSYPEQWFFYLQEAAASTESLSFL